MKHKLSQLFFGYTAIFFALICCGPLLAYQMADGNPPPTTFGAKYIFYWGKLQCDLSPANNYQGQLSCTHPEFRQMLLHAPHLWNGTQMAERVNFQLEGVPVVSTRGSGDYSALIGVLDEAIGQKVAAGQVLQLTNLYLDDRINGHIDLFLTEAEPVNTAPVSRSPAPAASNMLDTRFLQSVVWGREDIYENSNRDFFSETEFWRTVQQFPALAWAPNHPAVAVRAGIQIKDTDNTSFELQAALEAQPYLQLVESLNNYRHLLKPGSKAILSLYTADQYDRLYEKNMYIVADNDPRIALRQNRDTHTFSLEWGGWKEMVDNVYLLELQQEKGPRFSADPPIALVTTTRNDDLARMMAEGPKFWIDGEPAPDVTFRLQTPAGTKRIEPGQPIPDSLLSALNQHYQDRYAVKVDALQVAGYDLSALSFELRFFYLTENLRVRNQLSALLAAPSTAWAKIFPPTLSNAGYAVDFEILRETAVQFSIFNSEGENVFTLDNMYPQGRHTLEIPRLAFKQPGKYYLFLNTIYGIGKQELVLE